MPADRTERLTSLCLAILQQDVSGYVILQGASGVQTISCLRCGWLSTNPTDIAEKYCGHCRLFHEDPRR